MFNSATLLGRVGKKNSQTLKNGNQVTVLSVATSKKFKDSQGIPQEQTTWHRVSCFGKLQEIAGKYVQVGDMVFLQGDIQHKQIESGEKAGQFMYSINANELRFIPKGTKDSEKTKAVQKEKTSYEFSDDEVLF
jgi:single-strand DNA-binding protein